MKCSDHRRRFAARRRGMTLLELAIVAIILVALASIAMPMFTGVSENSRSAATNASFRQLQDVILNRYVPDMKGVLTGDVDGLPRPIVAGPSVGSPRLRYLFVNPATETFTPTYDFVARRGWNGPYLTAGLASYPDPTLSANSIRGFDATYGSLGDPTVLDGWGNPIVLMLTSDLTGAYLVSGGPNGILNTTNATVTAFMYSNTTTANDDLGIRLY